MKRIFLFLAFPLFILHSSIFTPHIQAQGLDVGDTPVVQRIQLTGGSGTMLSTPSVDLKVAFDVDNEILNVTLISRTQGSDVVWVPIGGLDRGDMKKYTLNEMHMKCKMTRQFKRQIAFGVPVGIQFSNAEPIKEPVSVLLSSGDSVQYALKVRDFESPVVVKLAGLVSARVNQLATSEQLKYNYVADEVAVSINVKGDPCRIDDNVRLMAKVMQLNAYSDSLGEDIRIARSRKDAAECRRLKKTFEDSVQVTYNDYIMSIGRVQRICPEIEEALELTADNIRMARMVKCEKVTPTITPSGQTGNTSVDKATKRLREDTKELENCFDALKAGKDVESARERARSIIRKTDEFISSLPAKVAGNEQVRSRLRNYEIVKEHVEKRLK